jgi:diguanylate cyclase (GGDEF)-like protein
VRRAGKVPPREAADGRERMRFWPVPACWAYAGVGLILIVVYFANPDLPGLPDWAPRYPIDVIVNASAVVGLIVGIRRWRPDPVLPWCLMAVSQAVYTIGDFVYYRGLYITHSTPFPGPADAFYLGRVPFMVAALALMIRKRSGSDRAAVIDSLIVGIAASLLSWVVLMKPYTEGALALSVRLTSIAYPVTDLMLVVMAVRLLAGKGQRGLSFRFLTAGLILLAATDSVYGWFNLHGVSYSSGSLVEVGWLAYYVSVGACGLHPSMRELTVPTSGEQAKGSRLRIAALGGATLVGPGLLASEVWLGERVDALPIAFASIAVIGLVILRLADVMHHQEQAEAEVRHQAFHDPLTGLANRALFYDRLEHALEVGRRHSRGLAVMLIDLDRFKPINDSLGHAAGDELLVTIGHRITACLRSTDTVARLGGDEFLVLAESDATVGTVSAIAERLIDAVAKPLLLHGHEVSVTASVGVTFAPGGADDADELVNNADTAMYTAKRELPGTYRIFEPSMHVIRPDVGLDVELRRALANGEFVVHYQPIASLETGSITGVEALVRWQHPERGLLLPAEFIPSAEASGAIVDIGTFVLRQACRQVKSWNDQWPEAHLMVCVNLSPRELTDPDLVTRIQQILRDADLDPGFLVVELTESALVVDPVRAEECLHRLKGLGVGLALDDFGTAFSSLSHLRRFPVDCLKIDKSFVDTIATDTDGYDFIKGVVGLAHTLGLTTVAEGVEDTDQVACLERSHCDLMQGYIIARALPPADVEAMIGLRAPTEDAGHLTRTHVNFKVLAGQQK